MTSTVLIEGDQHMKVIDIKDIAANAFRTRSIPEDGTVVTDVASYAYHHDGKDAIATPLVVDGAEDGDTVEVRDWKGDITSVTLPAYVIADGISWCDTPRLTFTPWWSWYYRRTRIISADKFRTENWERGRA